MNALEDFIKDESSPMFSDKISINVKRINFLLGFVKKHDIRSQKFVNLFIDKKNRKLAFTFTDKEDDNYKIRSHKNGNTQWITLKKHILKDLNMGEKDFKKYAYQKHTEKGIDIFIIELGK
ncbi:MAG: hypothetical protein JXQ93_02115 [Flavobacteriaceae bacterium]